MKNQFWPTTYEFLKIICFFDTGPWRFPFEYGFGGEGVSALREKKSQSRKMQVFTDGCIRVSLLTVCSLCFS